MFRKGSRYLIAMGIATLLVQITIAAIVLNYDQSTPDPQHQNAPQVSISGNTLHTATAMQSVSSDFGDSNESRASPMVSATVETPSEVSEFSDVPESESMFRAEAIVGESDNDSNLESEVDPAEVEDLLEAELELVSDTSFVAINGDSMSERWNAYQRAIAILNAAFASGHWTRDDFISVVPDMQYLNDEQREDLLGRFRAALSEGRLNAAAIAEDGVPMLF